MGRKQEPIPERELYLILENVPAGYEITSLNFLRYYQHITGRKTSKDYFMDKVCSHLQDIYFSIDDNCSLQVRPDKSLVSLVEWHSYGPEASEAMLEDFMRFYTKKKIKPLA